VKYEGGVARRKPFVLLVLLVALSALGCGEDCEGLCEARKDCAGADQDQDCAAHCERIDQFNERADCEDQYDELTSCSGDLDDICHDEAGECQAETSAYASCVATYCRKPKADCN